MRAGRLTRFLAISLPLAVLGGCGAGDSAMDGPRPAPSPARAAAQPYAPMPGVISQLRVAVRSAPPGASSAHATLPVELPAMPGPHPYWSGVSASISEGASGSGHAHELAGTLAVPSALFAGRIQEGGPRSLFLLDVPLRFEPEARFVRPLRGITVELRLADHRDWSLLTIPRMGFLGLRHGPLPLPRGPVGFYFIAEELGAAASLDLGRHQALWPVANEDGSPLSLTNHLYAVVLAPAGAHDTANAVLSATLHFSPGEEGSVATPQTRITISLGAGGRSTADSTL